MADTLPTNPYYKMGGVNAKASLYEMSLANFLNIRNMDFDLVGAHQRRPGSTYASVTGLSGAVISLFEFQTNTNASWIIAHDSTALWYMYSNAGVQTFTLLSQGWNSGQPANISVFENRAWIANGQTCISWDGNTVLPLGLPCPQNAITFMAAAGGIPNGASNTPFSVFGLTCSSLFNGKVGPNGVAIFAAYSYVRGDGYYGPVDFVNNSVNIIGQSSLSQVDNKSTATLVISGFTAPANCGITAFAFWIGVYGFSFANATSVFDSSFYNKYLSNDPLAGIGHFTASPSLDTTQFRLFTLLPTTTATLSVCFADAAGNAENYSAANFFYNQQFSGVPFCWFNTNTPRYVTPDSYGYMYYSGFSNSPSTVWFSNAGQPEQIEPSSNVPIVSNDGDRIFGQIAFQGQMLFFKERSFWAYIGTNPNNNSLVQISNQYGCLSQKTIVSYNQKLLWLDSKGIMEYNGAAFDCISSKELEPVFRTMNVAAAKENACAVHQKFRNQIWWGIPVNGATQNNLTIVFDYNIQQWTYFDGFNPASFGFLKAQLNKQTVFRGDYSGNVYYHSESFMVDAAGAFTCIGMPRFENVGGENQTSLWRRFFLDTTPQANDTTPINILFFSNYATAIQATASVTQNVYQNRLEVGIQAKSVSVQWSYFGTYPITINGYAWGSRPLRNV